MGFWRAKGEASAIAVHDVGDLALAGQYAVVALGDDDRVLSFVEKPAEPESTLAATATYVIHAAARRADRRVPGRRRAARPIGLFPAWLHSRAPVYGYRFEGAWLDIGDHGQLLEADNRMRARAGLEPRAEYAL